MSQCEKCGKTFPGRSLGSHTIKCGLTPEERFWRYVERGEDCWLWKGGTRCGYGRVNYKGRPTTAHRVSWELANGPVPAGMQVLHTCDVRLCCNPKHLFIGDWTANMADCVSKDRHARGERSASARLTPDQVSAIRAEYRWRSNSRELATRYGVSSFTITDIVARRSWKHLP